MDQEKKKLKISHREFSHKDTISLRTLLNLSICNFSVSLKLSFLLDYACGGGHHCWAAGPLGLGLSLYIYVPPFFMQYINPILTRKKRRGHVPEDEVIPLLPNAPDYHCQNIHEEVVPKGTPCSFDHRENNPGCGTNEFQCNLSILY
jgi:hypothetical protein